MNDSPQRYLIHQHCLVFVRQGVTLQFRLARNLLWIVGWPQTHGNLPVSAS